MGPAVPQPKALDTAQALRERITSHPRLIGRTDETHQVWDPDSAWNEALSFLHDTTRKRGGGLVAQLDLSATPKNNKGSVFRHVVCDTPLGEAVDAGIVKTPIIGHGEQLIERAHGDAAYKYENHLTLGYKRWLLSKDEWERSGKKALLFVMTESTAAANQIAHWLNSDPAFAELNGKTINLHTNLKGKLKKRGKGATAYYEFIEDEKSISDDDLTELRLGLNNRWQTKRGIAGQERIIDWIVLDFGAVLFPNSDRDNFGAGAGLLRILGDDGRYRGAHGHATAGIATACRALGQQRGAGAEARAGIEKREPPVGQLPRQPGISSCSSRSRRGRIMSLKSTASSPSVSSSTNRKPRSQIWRTVQARKIVNRHSAFVSEWSNRTTCRSNRPSVSFGSC